MLKHALFQRLIAALFWHVALNARRTDARQSPAQVDDEIRKWLKSDYQLGALLPTVAPHPARSRLFVLGCLSPRMTATTTCTNLGPAQARSTVSMFISLLRHGSRICSATAVERRIIPSEVTLRNSEGYHERQGNMYDSLFPCIPVGVLH